jgi:hypothetical protein
MDPIYLLLLAVVIAGVVSLCIFRKDLHDEKAEKTTSA